MSFTFDTSTNIGKVRTLICDTDATDFILSDEEIQVFLDLTSDDIFLSSAYALRAIAACKAYLEKAIKAGNYSEDNKGMSRKLLDIAKAYEDASFNIPAEAVSEEYLTHFNWETILQDRALRGEC